MTLDEKEVNKHFKKRQAHMLCRAELETQQRGAVLYGQSDETSGFFQAQYDEESRRLHGMKTPWGQVYQWVAVTMGNVNSPGVYGEQRLDIFASRMATDEAWVVQYVDDGLHCAEQSTDADGKKIPNSEFTNLVSHWLGGKTASGKKIEGVLEICIRR